MNAKQTYKLIESESQNGIFLYCFCVTNRATYMCTLSFDWWLVGCLFDCFLFLSPPPQQWVCIFPEWPFRFIQCKPFVWDLAFMSGAFQHTTAYQMNVQRKYGFWIVDCIVVALVFYWRKNMEQCVFSALFCMISLYSTNTHQFNSDHNQCICDFHHKCNNWWLKIEATSSHQVQIYQCVYYIHYTLFVV